jgi:23S rRNA (pseudouridine1915-N3)-methyltransferase
MIRIHLLAVGRPRGAIGEAIVEYERRTARYFRFESTEVKETTRRAQAVEEVLADEGDRLLARIPDPTEVVALDRRGTAWSSEDLARQIERVGLHGGPGLTFVIGGAYGLSPAVLARSERRLSLSAMTLTHDMARLFLTEQIYRAGTILRGEPYHKASDR